MSMADDWGTLKAPWEQNHWPTAGPAEPTEDVNIGGVIAAPTSDTIPPLSAGCNNEGYVIDLAAAERNKPFFGIEKNPCAEVPLVGYAGKIDSFVNEGPDHSKLPYIAPSEYMEILTAGLRGYWRGFNSDYGSSNSWYDPKHADDLGSTVAVVNRIVAETLLAYGQTDGIKRQV